MNSAFEAHEAFPLLLFSCSNERLCGGIGGRMSYLFAGTI